MQAYSIIYTIKDDTRRRDYSVDARNLKSALKKIAKRHNVTENEIKPQEVHVIGFF